MIPLWISVAGGVGAVARFVTDGLVRTLLGRKFPWGTLIINILGSFILGVLTGLVLHNHASSNIKLILGTGFCGGFTTFSTFANENMSLFKNGDYLYFWLYIAGSIILGIGAVILGTSCIKFF